MTELTDETLLAVIKDARADLERMVGQVGRTRAKGGMALYDDLKTTIVYGEFYETVMRLARERGITDRKKLGLPSGPRFA